MPIRSAARAAQTLPSQPRPSASPFVKWVGGKGRLRHALGALLPPGVALMRHVEPFVGGGAMFFALAPQRALLSDVNPDLVSTYCAVRDQVSDVIRHLSQLQQRHGTERYYEVRERYNARSERSDAQRAAWFIYLNKTCFNGLHRVNKQGAFNVPIGRYANPNILDVRGLYAASERLAGIEVRHQPFETVLKDARPGDFVYADPPYEPISRTANFTSYALDGFGQAQQTQLRDVCRELDRRGCKLMLSNSDVPFIRDLYRGFHIVEVLAPRGVSCDGQGRTKVREVVVRNYH